MAGDGPTAAAAPRRDAGGALRPRRALIDGTDHRWLARDHSRLGEAEPRPAPVVMVHGLPTGPWLWRHVARWLADRPVLAWEMTGYAGSIASGHDRDLSLSAQAARLGRWLEHLGLRRVTLVGHDLGGGVAQILTVRQPQRVGALVLVNAVAFDAWPVAPVRAARALGPVTSHLPDRAFAAAFTAALRAGYTDPAVARTSIALHLAPYLDVGAAAALHAQLQALDPADTEAVAGELGHVGCPAAVVWGARDPFLRLPLGRRLAAALGAPLLRVPSGRHFVPEDHPRAVAAAVDRVGVTAV